MGEENSKCREGNIRECRRQVVMSGPNIINTGNGNLTIGRCDNVVRISKYMNTKFLKFVCNGLLYLLPNTEPRRGIGIHQHHGFQEPHRLQWKGEDSAGVEVFCRCRMREDKITW